MLYFCRFDLLGLLVMAGMATPVQRQMPAAFLRHVNADPVTLEAEITLLIARGWLQ